MLEPLVADHNSVGARSFSFLVFAHAAGSEGPTKIGKENMITHYMIKHEEHDKKSQETRFGLYPSLFSPIFFSLPVCSQFDLVDIG